MRIRFWVGFSPSPDLKSLTSALGKPRWQPFRNYDPGCHMMTGERTGDCVGVELGCLPSSSPPPSQKKPRTRDLSPNLISLSG